MKSQNQDHVVFEFNKITPNIYLGTNICCKTHFDAKLLKKGVTLDVSLEGERVDRPNGVNYFLWVPTRDHTAPSIAKLSMGVHAMREAIDAGEKVYVHCKNGHGRAPTMVCAYLIAEKGMGVDEAIAYIKKRRPEVHLEPSQSKRLRAWAKDYLTHMSETMSAKRK